MTLGLMRIDVRLLVDMTCVILVAAADGLGSIQGSTASIVVGRQVGYQAMDLLRG